MNKLHSIISAAALSLVPALTGCMASPSHVSSKPAAPPPTPLSASEEVEAWRRQMPASGSPAALDMPAPKVSTLPNGLSVYVLPRATAVVSLSLVVRQGAEATSPGKSGLAPLLARMLTEATRKHNAFELAEAAENFGATLNSSAQRDSIEVSLDASPNDYERALELLSEVVREPAFDFRDFERVRSQWLDDLLAERQSPMALASTVALRALYGTYRGAPINGAVSDVKKLQVTDLKEWHASTVVPTNSALIAVGPIEQGRLLKTAEAAFGNWKAPAIARKAVEYSPAPKGSRQVIIVDRKGAVQSALFAVQPFPRRLEPGHEARLLLSDVFGGLFTSRINMNLRETHAYTYGAHSSVIANRNFGVFIVQTSVRTDVTAESLNEVLSELSAITPPKPTRPIENEELARARADLVHHLGAHLEQNRILAGDLASVFVQGLPQDYFSRLPGMYSGLDANAVVSQQSLIQPDKFTIVIVGDRAAIEPPLTKAGFTIVSPDPAWLD